MDEACNRRSEDRLTYLWPIWFSDDFSQHMSPGQMLDISRGGIAFSYSLSEGRLREGQSLSISLSIPRLDDDDPASTVTVKETGQICRFEMLAQGRARVAVQFDRPLRLDAAAQTSLEIMAGDAEAASVFHFPRPIAPRFAGNDSNSHAST